MIIKSSEFVKSAVKPSQYPEELLPEIAFVGRSNVGKSTLINTLVNRKRLVKTSSTPGRTQLINFFDINQTFTLVDLPGYGYAKVPKRVVQSWGPMIETFLSSRTTLKGVVMLMDIRRTPAKEERELMEWFNHYDIPAIFVLTKADKFKSQKQRANHIRIADSLELDERLFVSFSSKTRLGKDKIWEAIEILLPSLNETIEQRLRQPKI